MYVALSPPFSSRPLYSPSLFVCIYTWVSFSLSYSPCCVRVQGSRVHCILDWLCKWCWGARADDSESCRDKLRLFALLRPQLDPNGAP